MKVFNSFNLLKLNSMKKVNRIKKISLATVCSSFMLLPGCANVDPALIDLGTQIAIQALGGNTQQSQSILAMRQMLDLSGDRASAYLSQQGSWQNVMPEDVQTYLPLLRMVDSNNYIGRVEQSMKQAASQAAYEAGPVFKQAVADISIVHVIDIIQGGSTAATDYFKQKTESALAAKFQPIITSNLQKTGFYSEYKQLLNMYNSAPISNKKPLDLENYISNKALSSLFEEMAQQESLIRQDPLGRGNQLIDQVLASGK